MLAGCGLSRSAQILPSQGASLWTCLEGISDEAILTQYTRKIPLSYSDIEWAMQIAEDLKQPNIEREKAANEIRTKGYEIKESAKILCNLLNGD